MWPGDEIVCRGTVVSIEDGIVKASVQAHRRGPGPDGLDLAEEELAITAEADIELPE